MTPFKNVLTAELKLIFSRSSAWLCIACSIFVAIVIPWLMSAAIDGIEVQTSSEAAAQGMANMMQEQIGKDVAKGMGRALWGRNFILIPLLILLAASSCLSGERGGYQLRETLCRPISRNRLLLAKGLGLTILCGLSLLATGLCAFITGQFLFEDVGELKLISIGYTLSLLSDTALIGLAFLVGTYTRSTGTTAIMSFIVLVLNAFVYFVSSVFVMIMPSDRQKSLEDWIQNLPYKSFSAWEGWSGGFDTEPVIGLFLLNLFCYGCLAYRFQKLDI
ncbi:MAG: ABC transporter permease subunit [Myxococcota bacterium]|nr:ABC transporter permease subunit [Myxococcota bacterium]